MENPRHEGGSVQQWRGGTDGGEVNLLGALSSCFVGSRLLK